MWQDLAAHGIQPFGNPSQVDTRVREVEQALGQVCGAIAAAAAGSGTGLERARSLRAKPAAGGKSLYECLNQLIHYWYCCAAARHLLTWDYSDVEIRPTGTDNRSNDKDAVDVSGTAPTGVEILGEVFCVSTSLWPEKLRKSYNKLMKPDSDARRLIFYNLDAKPKYDAKKRPGAYFLSINTSGAIALACPTDPRPLTGIAPLDGSDVITVI